MAYRKIDSYDEATTEQLAEHCRAILELLGEDPEREGLLKTPERVAKAMQFLTNGYLQDGKEILTVFHLRAPHAAFHRESACRIYSQRKDYRT